MKDNTEKKYMLDDPKNIQRLIVLLVALCVILFFADLLIHKHSKFEFENALGFYGVYGFISYVGLVLVAKHIIRPLIMRKEDYYGD